MSRLRPLALAAAAVLALCAFPGFAAAKTATTTKLSPIADCKANNGTLTQHYSLAQLEAGLKQLSPSIKEYTTCNAAIQDAINKRLGGKLITDSSSGSGGGGSGTLILIIVIVVVILLGGGGAYWAYRRNRVGDSDDPASPPPPVQG